MDNKRLLVFSDCYIYGGSEKLMAFLLKNEMLKTNYKLLFAYRKHKLYEEGLLNEGLLGGANNYGLPLLANETLFYRINALSLPAIIKAGLKVPFFIIEKLKIYTMWNFIVFFFFLLKIKPEIIHINNGGYPGAKSCNILVAANSITAKAKIVYQVNNQARKVKRYFDSRFDMFVQKHVSFFINASNKAKEQLVIQRKFNEEKILIVNNCVPLVPLKRSRKQICIDLGIPEDNFILTQVGFLSDRKGQQYLIKALKLLLDRHSLLQDKLSLLLIGNGENENILKELISDLGLSNNIFLLGYRTDSEDFIAAADVFVLPSISDEDMPLVLLSALGEGKPILATSFAGISQVIDSGNNGILISPDVNQLSETLAAKIHELINDDGLRHKLSANAKLSYKEYTPVNYGIRLNEIYKSLDAN